MVYTSRIEGTRKDFSYSLALQVKSIRSHNKTHNCRSYEEEIDVTLLANFNVLVVSKMILSEVSK